MVAEHQADVKKAAALVTSVFLNGTQNPLRRGQSIPFIRNQNWLIGTRCRADPRSPTATKNRRSACPDNGIMQRESAIIAAIEHR
jgi:hypothetical protein